MRSSRRSFLAAGLALPAAGLAIPTRSAPEAPVPEAPAPGPAGKPVFRTLGKTGMQVISVACGCMLSSDPSVLERAADLGINYFDTARVYQGGNNERMVGTALKSRRKQLYLSTKTGAHDKQGALEHLDQSLSELGTDYVDVWHLHGKSSAEELTPDLLEAQQIAKKAGKIRFAGVSIHSGHASVIPAAIQSGQIDVLLISYNFTMGSSLDALIDQAHAAGVGLVAMKVMAGGFRRNAEGSPIRAIIARPGAMGAALRWVLKNPKIGTTIPSIGDMEQLEDNFRSMSAPFSAADEKTLAAHLERIRPLYCSMCGECDGACPQGLPVAEVLRSLMYAEGYGQFGLGREHYASLELAARCSDCPGCQVKCPHGVEVARRMLRAQELFA